MFGEQLIIENRETAPIQFVVSKKEADFAAVRCVTVNQKIVDFQNMNGSLQFKASIPPTGAAEIRCAYHVSMSLLGRQNQPYASSRWRSGGLSPKFAPTIFPNLFYRCTIA
jgi:hypothetical protein